MSDDDVVIIEEGQEQGQGDQSERKPDDGAAELKRQLEEMTRQREDADRARAAAAAEATRARDEAARATREAEQARTESAESQSDTIASGIAAAKAEIEAAKRAYATAFDAGNAAAMADAQEKIGVAASKLVYLDGAKSDLDARRKTQPERQTEQRQDDPVETYIARFSGPSQQWLRSHRAYVTDQRLNRRLGVAHDKAEEKGIAPDTPEYFAFIEEDLGLRQKTAQQEQERKPVQQQQPNGQRPVTPVAPVNNGGSGGSTRRQVALSPGERAAATDGTIQWGYDDPKGKFKRTDPIGVQEYARRKLAMMDRGDYTRGNE